ncbi:unnamed protein product [Acanthoscelides obtectus]|uniref:Uncharacterized protein n=1 Tax=Acanthoscelides obtectus TaxID=200917 RepID=A0A9P0KHY6_ACAOB|nr:unnamed protein product [Acanthoscelides obtectus]CAK1650130.1 hypothetical protein AOBTE_LOCUS16618 [Acanthoscelides obtectus]
MQISGIRLPFIITAGSNVNCRDGDYALALLCDTVWHTRCTNSIRQKQKSPNSSKKVIRNVAIIIQAGTEQCSSVQ